MTYNPREFWNDRALAKGRGYVGPGGNAEKTRAQTAILSDIVERLLDRAQPYNHVLDFGCGVGRFAPLLTQFADNYTGFDLSEEGVRLASESMPWENFLTPIAPYQIPLPDNAVDLVTAITVLHHVPDNEWHTWTSEIRRVLKPGGDVLVIDNYYNHEVNYDEHMIPRKPPVITTALGCEVVSEFIHRGPTCWCALLRHVVPDEASGHVV